MKARQNPLSKFKSFLQRAVNAIFVFLPSKLHPTQVARQLEQAMEDNIFLLGEGRRLAPNVYDIFVSIKDHQQLANGEAILKKDWQDHLISVARQRHYTLRSVPVLRLHASSELRPGVVRVEAELLDRQHMSGTGNVGAEAGIMATQALSAEQLAQLRTQLPPGQSLPGISSPNASYLGQPAQPVGGSPGSSSIGNSFSAPPGSVSMPPAPAAPAIPQAWLTIRLPQANQQIYRIEKPIINIGRQLSNDIIVEDKRVSRYHAQIKYQPNGQFAIFDLGSTNGITINGTPHMRQHTLQSGDRFTIGSYDFYFERR